MMQCYMRRHLANHVWLLPFELDWPIGGMLDIAPFAVIHVDDWFHMEPKQNSFSPNFLVHFEFSFRESSLSHTFTLKSSPGLLFQGNHESFVSQTEIFLVRV